MSQFAVLRIMKYNPSTDKRQHGLSNIGAHIDRHHIAANVDQRRVSLNETMSVEEKLDGVDLLELLGDSVERSKTHLNRNHNSQRTKNLEQDIERRIQEGHVVKDAKGNVEVIKKNAVRALFFILTGSHERMHEIYNNKELWEDWKKANQDFLVNIFGKENIVRFEIHIDEKTPHIHGVVVPINKEGRLSARSFVNGGKTMIAMQDSYAQAMKPFGLERGIPKDISHRTQRPSEEYNPIVEEIVKKAKEDAKEINAKNALVPGKLKKVQDQIIDNLTQLGTRLEQVETKNKHLSVSNQNLMSHSKSRAYEQSLKEAMDEKLEQTKRDVALVPLLLANGWTIDKTKTTKKDAVLNHPTNGDKLRVRVHPNPANGHYVFAFSDGSGRKGGTILDLLEAYPGLGKIKDYTDKIIVLKKHTTNEPPPHQERKIDQRKAKEEAQKRINAVKTTQGRDFLANRQIEKRIHTSFSGVKVGKHEALFSLYKDLDKEGGAELCSTISYVKDKHGNSKKYCQGEADKGVSILLPSGFKLNEVKRFVVAESPVDGLSYWQLLIEGRLHQDRKEVLTPTAFLSTCGTITELVNHQLKVAFEMAAENDQIVVLAMDNDKAGRVMTQQLINLAEEAGCRYEVDIPIVAKPGKDWNDQLCTKGKENIHQRASEKTWKIFEEVKHEKSLLPRVASALMSAALNTNRNVWGGSEENDEEDKEIKQEQKKWKGVRI